MRLGSFCEIIMGQSPDGSSYNKVGIGMPFLQGNRTFGNIYPTIDTWCSNPSRIANKGTILLSVRAPVGDVNISNERISIGRGLCSINAGEYTYFLFYWLKQNKKYLEQIASGTTFQSVCIDDLKQIKINSIDKNSALNIGQLLFEIDSKIELNNTINDNLSQQISLIYDFWFKQFNFPNEKGQPYAQNGGKLIFDSVLKRTIPAGWSSSSLIHNPFSKPIEPGVDYFHNKNYLATANIIGTAITDGEYVSYESRESRANMQPKAFSVWFAKMKNSVKHLFISGAGQYFLDKYILSTGFEGLLCDSYAFGYICGIISDPTFEVTKDRYSHGATQQSVNNDDLDLYKIPIPPLKILQDYSKVVDPLYEKMNYLVAETNQLMTVRDYLLPLLLNGQVTLR